MASVAYTNLNLSYNVPNELGQFNVYLNIQNLFNKAPPPSGHPGQQIQPNLASNGFICGDDVVGRYYNVGVCASKQSRCSMQQGTKSFLRALFVFGRRCLLVGQPKTDIPGRFLIGGFNCLAVQPRPSIIRS